MNEEFALLEKSLTEGFKRDVNITMRRPDLFQVLIPVYYPDGDMIEVFFQMKSDNTVVIQDLGITLMRLTYDFNMDSRKKKQLLSEILAQFQVNESGNNLSMVAPIDELFPYLMQFLQVIVKVSDISYLKREIVKSLFYEYFDGFMMNAFEGYKVIKEYYPDFDKEHQYPTPYAIMTSKSELPLCFYPIANDERCNETTITIQHYDLNKFRPDTIAVFENQEVISRKPLARLSNIVGKQFSTLQGNEGRILEFTQRMYPN